MRFLHGSVRGLTETFPAGVIEVVVLPLAAPAEGF